MAKANPQTIILKGTTFISKEKKAGAAGITPGYLLDHSTTAGDVIVHGGAGLTAQKMFALENEVFGDDIDTDYADNDQVLYAVCPTGTEVFALLAASAAAIVIGDSLESAGDGTLRIATADAATDTAQRNAMVAMALEAVDNSGGGTEVRIKVEVL